MRGSPTSVPANERLPSDWYRLLLAQAISTLGSQVTVVALPGIAVLHFGAGIGSASLLLIVEFLPAALLSPWAGVLLDRARMRRVLIPLDLARALVLATAAGCIATDVGGLPVLYVVAGLLGVCGAVFDAGSETVTPSLVHPQQLGRANSIRGTVLNVCRIAGPALGGLFLALLSPASTLVFDAATFIASAVILTLIRHARMRQRPEYAVGRSRSSVTQDVVAGMAFIRGDRVLGSSLLGASLLNIGGSGIGALFFVYVYDDLGLTSQQVGVAVSVFSLGAIVGAAGSNRIARLLGTGTACAVSATVAVGALTLIPLATLAYPISFIFLYEFLFGLAATAWSIALMTLRQIATPPDMLGRISSLFMAIAVASVPVGVGIEVIIASSFGIVPALWTLCAVAAIAPVAYWRSSYRNQADQVEYLSRASSKMAVPEVPAASVDSVPGYQGGSRTS